VRLVEHSRNCILRLGFGSERYLQNLAKLRRFFESARQIRHTTTDAGRNGITRDKGQG
jgi:hypothetical protein